MLKKFFKILAAVLICQAAGLIGSLFTMPAIETWYGTLVKPEFNPPSWVFGPVWACLYALMAIAVYLVWETKKSHLRTLGLWRFGLQLILNSLWSILFFGLHSPGLAFVEILVLWIAILVTTLTFAKLSRPAAYLMIPYFLWVSFAVILNGALYSLN